MEKGDCIRFIIHVSADMGQPYLRSNPASADLSRKASLAPENRPKMIGDQATLTPANRLKLIGEIYPLIRKAKHHRSPLTRQNSSDESKSDGTFEGLDRVASFTQFKMTMISNEVSNFATKPMSFFC